jgi:hypothetical protein
MTAVHKNDKEVGEQCSAIKRLSRGLDELQAGSNEMALFRALSDIQRAAEKAQWRMNDLLYGKSFKPPEEQMGT